MEQSHPFDISWESLLRIAAVVAGAAIVYAGIDVILGFFVAIVIAAALDGPITWLQKKRIPRVVGALGIFLAGFVAVAGALMRLPLPRARPEPRVEPKVGNAASGAGVVAVASAGAPDDSVEDMSMLLFVKAPAKGAAQVGMPAGARESCSALRFRLGQTAAIT